MLIISLPFVSHIFQCEFLIQGSIIYSPLPVHIQSVEDISEDSCFHSLSVQVILRLLSHSSYLIQPVQSLFKIISNGVDHISSCCFTYLPMWISYPRLYYLFTSPSSYPECWRYPGRLVFPFLIRSSYFEVVFSSSHLIQPVQSLFQSIQWRFFWVGPNP